MEKLIPIGPNLNAFRFAYDPKLLDKIRAAYVSAVSKLWNSPANAFLLEGGADRDFRVQDKDHAFFGMSYGDAPLLWISGNDPPTHRLFIDFFDSLGIKNDVKSLVDYDKDIVLYCGFFVVGNRFYQPKWHVDYFEKANAYRLLAPLFPLQPGHGQLLYKDNEGGTKRYSYKFNEAIIVGEGFHHTTEAYPKTSAMRVLISLAFGTDKLQHWPAMERTIGHQSEFLILPCGHRRGACVCPPVAPAVAVGLP